MDSDDCQRLAILQSTMALLDYLVAIFTGTNFPERTGDIDLKETLCMDCLFRCCFNFVSGVDDSQFPFRHAMLARRLLPLLITTKKTIRWPRPSIRNHCLQLSTHGGQKIFKTKSSKMSKVTKLRCYFSTQCTLCDKFGGSVFVRHEPFRMPKILYHKIHQDS